MKICPDLFSHPNFYCPLPDADHNAMVTSWVLPGHSDYLRLEAAPPFSIRDQASIPLDRIQLCGCVIVR